MECAVEICRPKKPSLTKTLERLDRKISSYTTKRKLDTFVIDGLRNKKFVYGYLPQYQRPKLVQTNNTAFQISYYKRPILVLNRLVKHSNV